MAEVHTGPASNRFELIRHADGTTSWAARPVLAQHDRQELLDDPGERSLPELQHMPYEVNERIFGYVLRHNTPIMPVSKEDIEKIRQASSIEARYTGLLQEEDAILTSHYQTRGSSKRFGRLASERFGISDEYHESQRLLAMDYRFISPALFRVSRSIGNDAGNAFLESNEIKIRPTVEQNPGFNYWEHEADIINMTFDEQSSNILVLARRIHAVIHWHSIPILKNDLESRARYGNPLEHLRLSLFGKLAHIHEAQSYARLLETIPVGRADITWSAGFKAQSRKPPHPPAREVTWPELRLLFNQVENRMQGGGLPQSFLGTIFEPFPR